MSHLTQVRIFEYNPEVGKLELTQTEKLQMQAHTKCKCGCRIRAEVTTLPSSVYHIKALSTPQPRLFVVSQTYTYE